jgi:acetyl-CoA C-acetyltransferase
MIFGTVYDDVWLKGGARTGFADYGGVLARISPTDLGIVAAKAALDKAGTKPEIVDTVVGANVAQSSYDAFYFPRHVGIYSGVPIDRPALLVQRLCTSGFEAILQAADAIKLGKAETGLCVGAESMSRNPVVSYTMRGGFRMGQAEFKDSFGNPISTPRR